MPPRLRPSPFQRLAMVQAARLRLLEELRRQAGHPEPSREDLRRLLNARLVELEREYLEKVDAIHWVIAQMATLPPPPDPRPPAIIAAEIRDDLNARAGSAATANELHTALTTTPPAVDLTA